MRKYSMSEVMTKANRLRTVYGMSKAEALRKAWSLVKLRTLEHKQFILSMKDHWDNDDYRIDRELSGAILIHKNALYPRIIKTMTRDTLGAESRARMTAMLDELKAIPNPTGFDLNRIFNIEDQLENSVLTWTHSEFDETAYDAA